MSEMMQKIERAHAVVSELCKGEREWIMSIPARPDHDPDLIISDALRAAKAEIARLTRELEEAKARLEQYQRLVVFADSVARARGDACGLCDALGRDDQPYQSHRAAELIAEAERALIARRGAGSRE